MITAAMCCDRRAMRTVVTLRTWEMAGSGASVILKHGRCLRKRVSLRIRISRPYLAPNLAALVDLKTAPLDKASPPPKNELEIHPISKIMLTVPSMSRGKKIDAM